MEALSLLTYYVPIYSAKQSMMEAAAHFLTALANPLIFFKTSQLGATTTSGCVLQFLYKRAGSSYIDTGISQST
jgi:hypothetical protein